MAEESSQEALGRTVASTGTQTRASTVTNWTRTSTGTVAESVFLGRRILAAVAGLARRTVVFLRETVTLPGWLVAVCLLLGLFCGWGFGWSLGWVMAGAAALLLLLSVPFLFGGHDYQVSLELAKERVVAGTQVAGSLRVSNRAERLALPGTVDVPIGTGLVEAHVPLLAAGATHHQELSIAAARRGVIDVGPMSISRGDPVGILRREVTWPEIQTLHIHPVTALIPSTGAGLIRDLEGLPTETIVDVDLAFHAIRDYVPGDSQRHVHWKSTAKTGQLMVRQYEETRHSRIAVMIGIAAQDEYLSEDEFELAVSCAASLGIQAIRDRRELSVSTSAENPEVTLGEVVSVRNIPTSSVTSMLDGFSEIEMSERASSLEDIARLTGRIGGTLSVVFLVTGAGMPMDRLRAAAHAFPQETLCVVVRCELDGDPSVQRHGRLRVLTVGALPDLGKMIARGALL